jgi:hypothetical protein
MGLNFHKCRPAMLAPLVLILLMPSLALSQALSNTVQQQIADILSAKRKFTPAQQKMESALVFAAQRARGELAGQSFAGFAPLAPVDAGGFVTVEIKGAAAAIVNQVNALGGQVIAQFPQFNSVRARLPLQSVETLANDPSVTYVGTEEKFSTNVGALTSQGVISHSSKAVVTGLGIAGSGVKVGVLSDSASAARVAALQASGDLGAGTTVLPGQAGTGADEGAAMMEIVQDIAPGAQLFFATGFGGQAQFATNIGALAAQGCTIIVDDITYYAEGAFQDGTVAQAVNTFVAGGGLYFSSAGNSGSLTHGNSGTWEGDFVDGGAVSSPEPGHIHSFPGGLTYDTLNAVGNQTTLKWSDPLGASSNDYDLFALDSTGSFVKGFSANVQNGTQDPFEFLAVGTNCGTPSASGYCPAVGDRIVVVLFNGSARALRIDTNRGRLATNTTGATYGHNAAQNTVTVAATDWNSAKTGTQPFTGAANPTEVFSSDGPRKIFLNPNGTAITPGNFLFGTGGGLTLQKPDITAADGASAKTPGFLPFFGTSAAAPHAAGIAALIKAAKPAYTAAQIKTALINTSLDNMAPGVDRDGGYGVVMALQAVQYAQSH